VGPTLCQRELSNLLAGETKVKLWLWQKENRGVSIMGPKFIPIKLSKTMTESSRNTCPRRRQMTLADAELAG
jgi:hypothetical protein